MIFAFVFAKVKMIQWSTNSLLSYEYTKDDVVDLVQCNSNVYQVMLDGSLQVKGIKYGLQNQDSVNFIKTDISSVSRVFCVQNIFCYLTKSGHFMAEDGIDAGKLKFKQMLIQQVLDVSSTPDIVVALTTEGLFIQGDCQNPRCGIADSNFIALTKVTFSEFTQKIVAISIGESADNIFLYLENGDVYLTGESNIYPIPQDTVRIRKIGNGIKSVQMGWNVKIVQNVLYYLRGTDLVIYSDKLTPNEQIIQTGVIDFRLYQQQNIMIKEDKVELYFENYTLTNFEPLYCAREPTDPLCIKIYSNTYDGAVDCTIQSQEKICLLYICTYTPSAPVCQFATPCGDKDYMCWAIWCSQDFSIAINEPQCYINYVNSTIQILQQKPQQIFFIGAALSYFDQDPNTNKNKVSPGGAAGIAIAASFVVFTLILAVTIIQLKRKSINLQSLVKSTESVNSVLTTAQPVEAL
ncbi:Regulator_of chromosome condensation 1/beta-lactamase-inhibitor protein II [Hexamita inflata]|uniref:Regulator of chromosome condensation 1/beta-lactamase-inhibitor protein II n=1 Tax=Hexamita inflata TaxID=28002 RepID=A0AA86U0R2_9EUKA|nr:Regulator of chromosome condensation 1/beta-lactamase-inhibitor protein II [Hexamita inflata]